MDNCPHCGSPVPPKAKACPECGSDENTGWSENAETSGLDLPDEEFNYDEFVAREFDKTTAKPSGISWLWWVVGVVVAILLIAMLMWRG